MTGAGRAREVLELFAEAARHFGQQIVIADEPLSAKAEWICYRDGKCRRCHREPVEGLSHCKKHLLGGGGQGAGRDVVA